MNDGRRRRKAKQARRDAQRMNARDEATQDETPEETPLIEEVRQALATGHPLDLLGMVSLLIEATKPDPQAYLKSRQQREVVRLDDLITGFVGVPIPETTALLTVLAELLIDDPELQLRCRQESAARHDSLPQWISDLPNVDVYRVVRKTHVLGDGDELLIGARLAGGHELTCVAHINHLMLSEVNDAFFVPASIDRVTSIAVEQNTDPDTDFVEMSLADAGAWLQHGLDTPLFVLDSDSWPGCRALLRWLIGYLPAGGQTYQSPDSDEQPTVELCNQFFASPSGTSFRDYDYRKLLRHFLDSGAGDPLRWSAARIEQALGGIGAYDESLPTEIAMDAPELLRAFVPFVHARSGIRDELTAEALAAIDQVGPGYEQVVREKSASWEDD